MIVPMKKAVILCLKEEREALLLSLQQCGELMPLSDDPAASPAETEAAGLQQEMEALLRQLKPYREKSGLFPARPAVDSDDFLRRQDEAIALRERMEEALAKRAQAETELAACRAEREALRPWLPLEVPVERVGRTAYTVLVPGLVPTRLIREAQRRIRDAGGELQLLDTAGTDTAAILIAAAEEEQPLLDLAKELEFSQTALPVSSGRIRDRYDLLTHREEEQTRLLSDSETALRELAADADKAELLLEQARAAAQREATPLIRTVETVCLEGWVRSDRTDRVEQAVRRVTDAYVFELRDPGPQDDPPVATQNNRFVRQFEPITDMFSTPGRDDVDPNPVMAPWYWLIFGMMMGDVGYGAVLVLGTLLFKKLLKPKGDFLKLINIFFYSGFTTMLCGVLFGSYFGVEFHPVISPLNQPLPMLVLALGIGVLHIFSGMILHMVRDIRDGRVWDAIFDQLSWMVLIVGLVLLFVFRPVGIVLSVLGAGTILLTAGRHKKGIGKVTGGLLGLYNITGFMGDILSYSRIFALCLSSGVVAMVMNLLAGMAQGSVWTFPFAILIYVVGHTFNLAMGLLSAYVHDSRLQYIEFFGKFYDGGGRPFRPLALRTQYIDLVPHK